MKFYSVVATSGRPALLARTLTSLQNCVKPPEYEGVLLIENGPARTVERLARSASGTLNVRYQHIPVSNLCIAYNHLLERHHDALFYFHDDDVRVGPDSLMTMWRALSAARGPAFGGGPLAVDYDQAPPEWLKVYLPFSAKGWSLPNDGVVESGFNGFLGGNWAAYTRDLILAGGFPDDMGPGRRIAGGSETYVQQRMRKNGVVPVYVSSAPAWHYVPRSRCSMRWSLARARKTAGGIGKIGEVGGIGRFGRIALSSVRVAALSPIRAISVWRCLRSRLLFSLRYQFVWHWFLLKGMSARKSRVSAPSGA